MPTMRFGRLVEFDDRSRDFPIMALASPATSKPRSYTWRCDETLDQGNSSSCVGHAWAHEIAARPAVDRVDSGLAFELYRRAQQIDYWPGEEPAYYGTSILAGAKAAQQTGRIGEYRWAFGIDDLVWAVGYRGPAVVGVNWLHGMFLPDSEGIIRATGPSAGGHAVMVNGVSLRRGLLRVHNSWGSEWGESGAAYIPIEDMARLLDEQGEACIPVERIRSY